MAYPGTDSLLRIPPTASAWNGVGGPSSAPDWDAWEVQGNLAPPQSGIISPSQMPTYDDPGNPGITPEQSAAARAALLKAIAAPYTTGATSYGQPAPTAAHAPSPAQPQPAPQDQGWAGPLPTPPIPPSDATTAPATQAQAPSEAGGIASNKRHSPLNLRFAGQTGATNDNGFASFATDAEGLDAARAQMALDANKYGVKTLRGLVTTWLGGTDPDPVKARLQAMKDKGNDPDAYVASVAKATGIDPDAPLDVTDPAVQNKIIPAMSVVENGRGAPSTGVSTASAVPTPAPAQPQQGAQPEQGQQPWDIGQFMRSASAALPYSADQLAMPKGAQLLALAGGLLSGRSPAEALGRGFSAASQAQMADIANKRAINSQMLQLANLGMLTNYRGNMTALAAGRLQNAEQNTKNRSDVGLQAALAGNKSAAQATMGAPAKENAEDIDELYNEGADAGVKQEQIAGLTKLAQSGQVATGPGLNAVKRMLSNYWGVDLGSDPTATQITSAIASQIRGTSAFAKNMRNVREFNSIMEGLPNVDLQNPQALARLATGLNNMNNLKLKLYNDFRNAPNQAELRANQDAFQNWRANEIADWRKQLAAGGGLYGDGSSTLAPTASSPTTASAAPAQGVSGTTATGVKWSLQ